MMPLVNFIIYVVPVVLCCHLGPSTLDDEIFWQTEIIKTVILKPDSECLHSDSNLYSCCNIPNVLMPSFLDGIVAQSLMLCIQNTNSLVLKMTVILFYKFGSLIFLS